MSYEPHKMSYQLIPKIKKKPHKSQFHIQRHDESYND